MDVRSLCTQEEGVEVREGVGIREVQENLLVLEHLLCGVLAMHELAVYLVADGDAKLLQLW